MGLAWPAVCIRGPQGSVRSPVSNYLAELEPVNSVEIVGI